MLSMHGNGTGESEGKLGMVGAPLLAYLAVLPRPLSRTADTLRRLSPLLCLMSSLSLPSVVVETPRKASRFNRLAPNQTMKSTGLHFAS